MIWLIGCNGMLGKEFSCELRNNKMKFVETDRELDIRNIKLLLDFTNNKNITWIINCSAYTDVDKAEEEYKKAFAINQDGVANIAKVAKEIGAKLIHFSTDYIFDGSSKTPYTEIDIPNPMSIYGKSKLQGEIEIAKNLKSFFIFRISWLYGEHGNNFIYSMLRLFSEKTSLGVVNDQIGSPTYAKHVVSNILIIIISNSSKFGIFHYSDDGDISWYDFATEIKNITQSDISIYPVSSNEYKTKATRPKNSKLNKNKVRQDLEFTIYNWKDNLKEFLSKIRNK